jgi:hypothetical protein
LQREKWEEQGVVIWDHEAQEITRLTATQALRILDQLRTRTDWKQQGVIVGEPATRISLDNPGEKPQKVLVNQIRLDATQVQGLLDLLQNNEEILQQMSEAEEKESRRRLSAVYDILLKCARRRDEKEQKES